MNEIQMKKVREIMGKITSSSDKPEVGSWIEKDHVYLLVKTEKASRATRLYAIDREGSVSVHRNYAPMQLIDDTLIMSCPRQSSAFAA
jgi:hypothetical protein